MLRLIAFCACLLAGPVHAQTNVNLGGIAVDTSAAIEVTADSLSVDQNQGTALFQENVIIVQGEMRLSADEVLVYYDTAAQGITQIDATGNVILISGQDAAESEKANYNVDIYEKESLERRTPRHTVARPSPRSVPTGLPQLSARPLQGPHRAYQASQLPHHPATLCRQEARAAGPQRGG